MKLVKKIIAAVSAAAVSLTMLAATAFANDVIGTNPVTLEDGVEVTELIPYDDSHAIRVDYTILYDDGHNYKDFKFTAPASGIGCRHINDTITRTYGKCTKEQALVHFGAICASPSTNRIRIHRYSFNEMGVVVGGSDVAGVLLDPIGLGAGMETANSWFAKSISDSKKKPKKE